MPRVLARARLAVLRWRLSHTLIRLCDLVARYDFAVYELDKETGDEVARAIKRTRRRAAVFASALQRALPQPTKESTS
jgi:hypothetical protein